MSRPPELLDGRLDERRDGVLVGDVERRGVDVDALGAQLFGRFLECGLPAGAENEVDALVGELRRDRLAEPSASAGDDGLAAGESQFHGGAFLGGSRVERFSHFM